MQAKSQFEETQELAVRRLALIDTHLQKEPCLLKNLFVFAVRPK